MLSCLVVEEGRRKKGQKRLRPKTQGFKDSGLREGRKRSKLNLIIKLMSDYWHKYKFKYHQNWAWQNPLNVTCSV